MSSLIEPKSTAMISRMQLVGPPRDIERSMQDTSFVATDALASPRLSQGYGNGALSLSRLTPPTLTSIVVAPDAGTHAADMWRAGIRLEKMAKDFQEVWVEENTTNINDGDTNSESG
jgi:hypothetical protein